MCHQCQQRVALADTHGAADLLGDDDPSQIVDPPYDSSGFHFSLPPAVKSVDALSIRRFVLAILPRWAV